MSKKIKVLSKCMVLWWAAFLATLGRMWPAGRGLDTLLQARLWHWPHPVLSRQPGYLVRGPYHHLYFSSAFFPGFGPPCPLQNLSSDLEHLVLAARPKPPYVMCDRDEGQLIKYFTMNKSVDGYASDRVCE